MGDMCECGHHEGEHGQERSFYYTESRREVCLMCDGYEEPGYPLGNAWHRFKPVPVSAAPSIPGEDANA